MKTPILSTLFCCVCSFFFAQDTIDFEKTPIEYIREGRNHEASVVMDTLSTKNPVYFFTFGLGLPVQLAFEGDTLCRNFLASTARGNYLMSPFAVIINDLCALKHTGRGAQQLYMHVQHALEPGKPIDLLTFYAVYCAARRLEDIPYFLSVDEHRSLFERMYAKLQELPDGQDAASCSLRKVLNFNTLYEVRGIAAVSVQDILGVSFAPADKTVFETAPLYNGSPFFHPVFETKIALLKAEKTMEDAERQHYAVQALLEDPTKKHAATARRFFRSNDSYRLALNREFSETQPLLEFPPRIAVFLSAQHSSHEWLVVDIWGTWCSPCVDELPAWQEFYTKEHRTVNFAALSAFSSDADTFLAERKYTFPNLQLEDEEVKALELTGFPTTLLIAPDGKVMQLPFSDRKREIIRVLTGMGA